MSTINTPIPQTLRDWARRAEELDLLTTSMRDLPALSSASTMTESEFITLRAIWPKPISILRLPNFGSFSPSSGEIKDESKKIPGLREYLLHIKSDTRVRDRELRAFMLARDSQLRIQTRHRTHPIESNAVTILRLPPCKDSPQDQVISVGESASTAGAASVFTGTATSIHTRAADQDPRVNDMTKDEEIVNVALMEFLRAVTLSMESEVSCQWSNARAPFAKAEFGDNAFTARVDGYLEGSDDSEILAIVEVKAAIRNRIKHSPVLWQETAEMVAWIMHDRRQGSHTPAHSYWLISQDHNEIYLTQAIFNENYIKYLEGDSGLASATPQNKDDFLKMQEHGPWKISNHKHMRSLARVIVALTLDVTEKMRQANVESSQSQ